MDPDAPEDDAAQDILEELRAFAEADARQLSDLESLLDDLKQYEATETFDQDRIWARVEQRLWRGDQSCEGPGR